MQSEDEIVERALAAIQASNKAWREAQVAPREKMLPEHRAYRRQGTWPATRVDSEQRFAKPHAKLFPFIGRKVRTPAGPGILLQVFADRVAVFLDTEAERAKKEQCLRHFLPAEVEPVSLELE
jgi:hypothetical protein